MLTLKVKGKLVDVDNYSSSSSYVQNSGDEKFNIDYHLYLKKKEAQLFCVGETVIIPSIEKGLPEIELTVKSIHRLSDGTFCIELNHKQENVKKEEVKKPEIKKEDEVDSIQTMVERVLSQEDLHKLPKHFIGIFSDGNKDTVAFELKNGRMEGIGVANRHNTDEFDFHTGADLAYARLTGAIPPSHNDCCDCNCDGGCDQEDHIWLHEEDDMPVLDTKGRALKLGDFVIGYKEGAYVPGVIGHSNNKFYLCNEQGPAIELEQFTDFDLVWRD